MSMDALSTKQFNTEKTILAQGNEDDLATQVRGYQHMTSNNFKPSFPEDYNRVRAMPSGTAFRGSGMGGEEEEEGGM